MKRFFQIAFCAFVITSSVLLFRGETPVRADALQDLQKQIEEYQAQVDRLRSQGNTLKNQIAQFDAQIKLNELKISQTEEKINQLGGRIDSLEVSLQSLSKAFSTRAVETYKMTRFGDSIVDVVTANNLPEAVKRYQYLQKIQEADRGLLIRLQSAQDTYKVQKTSLEDLQETLEKQRTTLASQKAAKNNLLTVTQNDEKKYQQLLSEAKAQLAAFRRFVSSQGGATILSGQTKCDGWGCYYNQRDADWGNQLMGNSDSTMKEFGCLVTSMAMVASHYGKGIKPGDIAATSGVFFGNTAYMNQGTWSVSGTTMTRTRVCTYCGIENIKSRLDSELNAGRPVVVGVYSGPDHFIVIKAKSGDSYVMNDPFLENGGDRPFNEKYNLTDIKTLDYVTIN